MKKKCACLTRPRLNLSCARLYCDPSLCPRQRSQNARRRNLDSKAYPCRRWTYSGVPCAHAVAGIIFAGRDYVDFVDNYLKVVAFESTYGRGIHAM
ncbi:hypothetical protein V1523DRAFT_414147 [Lipomyces doorenjongii]